MTAAGTGLPAAFYLNQQIAIVAGGGGRIGHPHAGETS